MRSPQLVLGRCNFFSEVRACSDCPPPGVFRASSTFRMASDDSSIHSSFLLGGTLWNLLVVSPSKFLNEPAVRVVLLCPAFVDHPTAALMMIRCVHAFG